MSDKDIVIQAREILAEPTMEPFLFGVTRDTFRALADEVERLRKQQKAHTEMVDDYYGSR